MKRLPILLGLVALLIVPGPVVADALPGDIYYIDPSDQHPGGAVTSVSGGETGIDIFGQGFDIAGSQLVWVDLRTNQIVIEDSGSTERVDVDGLFAIARPSLSPDGTQIAVQATETSVVAGQPAYLAIYVIDLADGSWRRLSPLPDQPQPGYELPEWLATGDRIAYWAVENDCIVIKIVDATTGDALITIQDDGVEGCFTPAPGTGPRFHVASNADGSRLLIVGQMQIYDVSSGELVTDLREEALAAMDAAGFTLDDRFPGQGNGGTFPLDGDFSPDGRRIVFDGAVRDADGSYGVIMMEIDADGTDAELVSGLIEVDPAFSNNHNFSQVTPIWLPVVQPDAAIRSSRAPDFIGRDIYNTTTEGQRASAAGKRGSKQRFEIEISNDGETTQDFTLLGTGNQKGFAVTYSLGGTNVTTAVVAGTLRVADLGPGEHVVIEAAVKIKPTATTGSKRSWTLRVASAPAAGTDAVRATVRVKG